MQPDTWSNVSALLAGFVVLKPMLLGTAGVIGASLACARIIGAVIDLISLLFGSHRKVSQVASFILAAVWLVALAILLREGLALMGPVSHKVFVVADAGVGFVRLLTTSTMHPVYAACFLLGFAELVLFIVEFPGRIQAKRNAEKVLARYQTEDTLVKPKKSFVKYF